MWEERPSYMIDTESMASGDMVMISSTLLAGR